MMKGKVAPSRPPRGPATPRGMEKTIGVLAAKTRRSAVPQKPGVNSLSTRPIPRPLTARDQSLEMKLTGLSKPGKEKEAEEEETKAQERVKSLSPARCQKTAVPINPQNRSTVDRMKGRIENYSIGRQLGQGAYAVVRLATHKVTKEKVAIKSYEKMKVMDPHRKLSIKREISILEKLSHEHAIKLIESIDSQKHISLVMEYVGGCSLHGYLKRRMNRRIEPTEAKRLFKQILSVIQYCHSLNVTHRDVKLENILLDESNNVKLIDFGFSTCQPLEKKSSVFCGTPSYMAPEIVTRKEYAGPPADVWALGVLLFAMLCGCFPFKGINDAELYRKIQKGMFAVPEHVEEMPKRLIKRMMQVDPSKRPTTSELLCEEWLEVEAAEVPQPDPPITSNSSTTPSQTPLPEAFGISTTPSPLRPTTASNPAPEKRLTRKQTAPIAPSPDS